MTLPSLNLDQVSTWNGNNGYYGNTGSTVNSSFNGTANFRQMAPARSFARPAMNGGYLPAGMETNIANDPMVRLN